MHCKDTILRTQNNSHYSKLIPNSRIQLEIVCENGDMKDLDGLIVNFTANMEGVNQNATLNKGMTLKLSNIRIHIKDGVTVDLN